MNDMNDGPACDLNPQPLADQANGSTNWATGAGLGIYKHAQMNEMNNESAQHLNLHGKSNARPTALMGSSRLVLEYKYTTICFNVLHRNEM